MAQTVEEIAEMLNEIRLKNELSTENLEKILSEINLKLSVITDDEAGEAIKIYITELKNLIGEKLDSSSVKINNLEALYNKIKDSNSELAKRSELKELFESFSVNFQNFLIETADRKNILDDINEKIDAIKTNSLDKNEIISQLKEVTEELSSNINSIPLKISFDEIEQKMNNFQVLIQSLHDEFYQNASVSVENSQKLVECISDISNKLAEMQEITDSRAKANYENISDCINGVKSSFENNSKLNYESIINEINNLKAEINSALESKFNDADFKCLNSSLDELSGNVELLKDISLKRYQGMIDNILSELHSVSDETRLKLNSDNELNFGELKSLISDVAEKFDAIKSEFLKINDSTTFTISSGFSNINTIFENIFAGVNSLGENFDNVSRQNAENILSGINNLSVELEELKGVINNSDFINSVVNSVDSLSEKLNILSGKLIELSEKDNYREDFEKIKDALMIIKSEYDISKEEFTREITENINIQSEQIKELSESFDNASKQNAQNILIGIGNLGESINELKSEVNSSLNANIVIDSVNSLSEKLDELSAKDNYREDFEKIKDSLVNIQSEYDISKEEFSRDIKENIIIQSEQIKEISENFDGIKGYISEIGIGLKDYISELNDLKSSNDSEFAEKTTQKLLDLEASLLQNTQSYETQFDNLQTKIAEFLNIVEASNSDTEGKILASLEEVTEIKNELISVHDVLKNVELLNDEKFSETISLIDAGVENIVFNINNINDSLKNGIDDSVKENILSIEEKLVELSDILNVLKTDLSDYDEKVVNEIFNQMSALKDEISLINTDITDAIQSKGDELLKSFEPLLISLGAFADLNIGDLLSSFKSELELSFFNFTTDFNKELKSNSEIFSNIKQSYAEILDKVSIVEEVVNKTLQNNIELLSISFETGIKNLNTALDEKLENQLSEMKAYFDVALNNTKSFDLINDFKEQLVKTIENIKNQQDTFSVKADELSANVSVLSDTIKSETKNIIENCSNEEVENLVEELKLDNTDIKGSLEIVDTKVGKLLTTSELISAINAKVDILASDDLDKELLDEIDELKSIIFEQRKFFEEASDEKAAAIDKYLRDVLVKLDSVDIEKSSEDIKEAVLNAVLSLSDQISFVEETEEIKDFVEEKTDSLNQSISEVHKQLKQLTSGDDDFEYIYTLQDVESDIAKLRLAVNNISAGKFEDISDEIKRIVYSVENLETGLTQEQIIDLKTDIEKLNEDIVSISSRTNKLLLNSDESYKAVHEGLSNFSDLICKLENRIGYLDDSDFNERLEKKIDNIHLLSSENANSCRIINQVMMYLGEWIDSTTQDISSISDRVISVAKNTSQLAEIKEIVEKVKELIPDNADIINELQNKFALQEENFEHQQKMLEHQEKLLENQQEKIDILERKLDKISSTLEEKDDMVLNRKVDKVEKLLSELSANIEKLTSYVE